MWNSVGSRFENISKGLCQMQLDSRVACLALHVYASSTIDILHYFPQKFMTNKTFVDPVLLIIFITVSFFCIVCPKHE